MPDLSAMLERGPVVCAEGYLFECERRGYLQRVPMIAKDLIPEVGTRSFAIMKGGRNKEVGVVPGAGVAKCPCPG